MDRRTELLDARERAGLSMEQAAERTKIPRKYLEALEKGDLASFPPGPFLSGYTRQYRKFLALPEASIPLPAPDPARSPKPRITAGGISDLDDATATIPSILRQSRGRLLGLAVALCAVLALGLQVVASALTPDLPAFPERDQAVVLRVTEPVRAEVVADGRTMFTGHLVPGPDVKFEAHDRLELDLASLERVTIQYNGRALKPLGAQSRPRRLVFIDDGGR